MLNNGSAARCPNNNCDPHHTAQGWELWNPGRGWVPFGGTKKPPADPDIDPNGILRTQTNDRGPGHWDPFLFFFAGSSPQNPPPQSPAQTPTPAPPCSAQDFSFSDGSGNYSVGDLSAIAQTAVGEASNAFYANEVEAVIGTIVNRQNLNIAAYPQRGPFARGQAVIATPGNLRGGVLGEYDAHRFGSGTTKLNGAKVNGVLQASSYVCDQLKAARDFAVRAGNMLPGDMRTAYPYTSNRGIGARLPAGATGVTALGNTRFFVDAGIRLPF